MSFHRRMDRLLDAILPPGSMARKEHELPDEIRAELAAWRAECSRRWEAVVLRAGSRDAAFERFLGGERIAPAMPPAVAGALGLKIDPLAGVGPDATAEEMAERWQRMLDAE